MKKGYCGEAKVQDTGSLGLCLENVPQLSGLLSSFKMGKMCTAINGSGCVLIA
jgi:hypothetical protein